jgi:hypothetical protein
MKTTNPIKNLSLNEKLPPFRDLYFNKVNYKYFEMDDKYSISKLI